MWIWSFTLLFCRGWQRNLPRIIAHEHSYCFAHLFGDVLVAIIRPWQTRTHCCWHIIAHDVSWARKRAGHKINVVFPCCTNWETFVADTKCFLKHFLCPGARGQTGKHLCRQQCVRNNVSSFARALAVVFCVRLIESVGQMLNTAFLQTE